MNGDSVTSKDVSNWQAAQNQVFKVHFSPGGNLKRNIACKARKKHLQAMDGSRGSFPALLWGCRWYFIQLADLSQKCCGCRIR